MYHIPNDIRAKKSAALIIEGLEKCLQEKPLNKIKISDIYQKSFVSRATFYRLFDSINDVLIYQCDLIIEEIAQVIATKEFKNRREMGVYTFKLWLNHEYLINAIVENKLYGLLNQVVMSHREGFMELYKLNDADETTVDYFFYFLVSIIYIAFVIYHREKGKKTIEEILETTNSIVTNITETWAAN